jgi:hypothetical protein
MRAIAPLLTLFIFFSAVRPGYAQIAGHPELSPIELAQGANPSVLPTDITPFQVNQTRYSIGSKFQFRLFQKLPARFWFTAITEESGRLETNVYQTAGSARQDYVFRSLPNITAGWALSEHTNVYCNYFVIKDIYARQWPLDFPTTMSLSMGIRRDFPIGNKTIIQFDNQVRELWQDSHLNQADLLPAVNLTRIINAQTIFFGSLLLQMRSHYPFEGPTRELDPFYNIGIAKTHNNWVFSLSDTFVTNFRDPPFRGSIPQNGVVNMILDAEIAHPLSPKLPGVTTFIRAEPIFNWRSGYVPGQSGFDFRLYGGLRLTISKPAYNTDIEDLRTKLRNAAQLLNQINSTQLQQQAPTSVPLP